MTETYLAIKLYIEQNFPDVLHIDLWNEQILNIAEEPPFLRPAIFIEFGEVSWHDVGKHSKIGSTTTTFHMVTDCYDTRADGPDAINSLQRLDEAEEKLDNLKLPRCTPFIPINTIIDNNHGNLIHNNFSYSFDIRKDIRNGKNYVQAEPNLEVTGAFSQNDG